MVDVNTIALYLGGPAAPEDWLLPKVGDRRALFCIHQMNHVNSCIGCALCSVL